MRRLQHGIPASISFLLILWNAAATIGIPFQMQLGNPSGATTDPNNHQHYLIQRAVEALDYSDSLGEARWASWDLTASDVGSAARSSTYFPDTNLPPNFYRITTADYNGVGAINFNRGHLCPSEDRTDNRADNDSVFLMSNIFPQSALNNHGVWGNFESYCRTLAGGNELLIMCGPGGFGTATIPSGKARIASNVWKVVVVVPPGGGMAVSRLTADCRVISVSIPNVTTGLTGNWQNYLTSAAQIERDTGLTFFSALPTSLAAVYRARVDGTPPPSVGGFSPVNAVAGASVNVYGSNLATVSTVLFNGVSAPFSKVSAGGLTAIVPAGAKTGPISVISAGGLAVSASPFTVPALPPILSASLTGSNSVVVSWAVTDSVFTLEQTADIRGGWIGVTNPIPVVGTRNQVVLSVSSHGSFFRLASP